MKKINVYIGYDKRESVAAAVCKYSIEKNTNNNPLILYLTQDLVPEYTRIRETNQSTDFTYTRFLVPFLMGYQGYAIFCDCDFIFVKDLQILMNSIDRKKAVSVVKHPRYIPNSQTKMDGIEQHIMPRKNWASLMVFNCSHVACKSLTPEYINSVMPGRKLHTFDWVEDSDIGSIPMEWNTLDGYYELSDPSGIHFTDGGPWFPNYKNTFYSKRWLHLYDDLQRNLLQ